MKATGIIAIATVISKILGFAREVSIAYKFGSTWQTDAYNIALSIPGLLFAAVATAIRTVFIPVFTDVATHRGKEKAMDLANNVINTTLLIAIILIVLGEIFAAPLVHLFARGFEGEVFDLAVDLTRIVLPVMIFYALVGIASGILNALQQFTAPALTGVPYNILIISGVFTIGSIWGIYGLAIATVVGIGSQLLILLPSLKKTGFRYRFFIDLRSPELLLILELMLPTLIGTAVNEINIMIDRMLASSLPEGSITALNYASRINMLPYGIVVSSVVTAIYPTMSQAAATKNKEQFMQSINSSLRTMSFLVMPMMVGLIVLNVPVTQVIYERGAFTKEATIATSSALLFYALGLLSMSWRDVINRGFWSLKDTLTPMFISAGAVVVNIIANLSLVGPLGHSGLALGTTIAATFSAFLALAFLRKKTGPLGLKSILNSLSKIILASLVMAVVAIFGWQLLLPYATTRLIRAILLFVVIGVSALAYFATAYILKIEEMDVARKIMRKAKDKYDKI